MHTTLQKCEVMQSLERPKCTWEGNVNMDLKEIGLEVMDWIHQT
jgi:hypothetical protein